MLDTLLAPLNRLDPYLRIRLWGVALTAALTLTDTLGENGLGRHALQPTFAVFMGVYAVTSLSICQLTLTPFLHRTWPAGWRWLAVIAGVLANPAAEAVTYGLIYRPVAIASAANLWHTYSYSLLATAGPRLAFWLALMLVLVHQVRRREEEVRVRSMETAFTQARLARLETQINPHFLFNALNTISALIGLNRKVDAVGAVASLGDLLRRSLKDGAPPLASIGDEIESASVYLQIEALRFPDRLSVIWNVDERFNALLIPRFTLQPLLENVVKHSVARSMETVTATVEIVETAGMRCSITVRNNGYVPSDPKSDSEPCDQGGVGLANLKQRTEILFPETGELICGPVEKDLFECRLTVPIISTASPEFPEENAS